MKSEDDEIKTAWRWVRHGLLLIVILVGGGYALKFACLPAAIVDRVANADNIIQNYEWFEDTYSSIKATEMKINNTRRTLKLKLRGFDRVSRETELVGLENHLAELIGKYNAKSRQITRKYFKTETLPYQLSYTDSLLKLDMNKGATQ